ncbi:MAG: class I SAM-dependent methyltransferase [bacterium]
MKKAKDRFVTRYREGYTPWAHKKADFNLVNMVREWPVKPRRVLEMGCGLGTDAIWMAEQGFEVTAVDAVDIAIQMARKVPGADKVRFLVRDFMHEEIPGGPFDFVFDRGFFHSFDTERDRKAIAKKVASLLDGNGYWLSLLGSCDSPPRDSGPPMRSARDIVNAVEPFFEIKLLKPSIFGSESLIIL